MDPHFWGTLYIYIYICKQFDLNTFWKSNLAEIIEINGWKKVGNGKLINNHKFTSNKLTFGCNFCGLEVWCCKFEDFGPLTTHHHLRSQYWHQDC